MNQNKSLFVPLSIKIVIIIVAFFVIGMIVIDNPINYGKGLALGGIFSILRIKLMEVTITRSIQKDPKAAKTHANMHYFFRYLLTLLVLIVAVLEPSISFIGAALGVISIKLAAYWQGYNEPVTPKDGSVQFVEWEDEDVESDF